MLDSLIAVIKNGEAFSGDLIRCSCRLSPRIENIAFQKNNPKYKHNIWPQVNKTELVTDNRFEQISWEFNMRARHAVAKLATCRLKSVARWNKFPSRKRSNVEIMFTCTRLDNELFASCRIIT